MLFGTYHRIATTSSLVAILSLSPIVTAASAGDRYVPPITGPVFNESPQITSEIRPFYMYNRIPGSFLTGGGTIQLLAVQVRLALTDKLGLIATKDGYADINFDSVLADERGSANIALGLKYAVLQDQQSGSHAAVGIRYEAPIGHLKTSGISMQGGGDGFVDLFVTGESLLGNIGVQGSFGTNLALDGGHDSSLVHANLHIDRECLAGVFGVIEANVVSTMSNGSRTAVNFEGFDLVNFGSTDSGTVATIGLGSRLRLSERIQLGVAWEFPVTGREDIIGERWTLDGIFQF